MGILKAGIDAMSGPYADQYLDRFKAAALAGIGPIGLPPETVALMQLKAGSPEAARRTLEGMVRVHRARKGLPPISGMPPAPHRQRGDDLGCHLEYTEFEENL